MSEHEKLPIEAQEIIKYYAELYEGKDCIGSVEVVANMFTELSPYFSDSFLPYFLKRPTVVGVDDIPEIAKFLRKNRIESQKVDRAT